MGFLDRFKKGGKSSGKASSHAQGLRHLENWELDTAVALLAQARQEQPDSLQIVLDLGRALLESSRHQEAEEQARLALDMAPDDPRCHLLAAMIHKDCSRYDQATTELEAAFTLAPSSLEAWLLQAQLMNTLDRPHEAREAAETVLRLDKKHPGANREMAVAAMLLRDLNTARRHVAQASDSNYGDPRNKFQHSMLALLEGDPDRALDDVEEALEINPWFVDAYTHKGYLLRIMDRLDEAESSLARSLELNPLRLTGHYYLGILHAQQNRLAEARQSLQNVLQIKPLHGMANWYCARLTRYKPGNEHLALMQEVTQAMTAEPQTPPQARSLLHFSLAKALEDLGEYDAAFAHLQQGNELQLEHLGSDFSPGEEELARVRQTFDAETLEQATSAPAPALQEQEQEMLSEASAMVFIVGMPRCGSSLVEQFLDSHPKIIGVSDISILAPVLNHVKGQTRRMPDESAPAWLKRTAVQAAPIYLGGVTQRAFRGLDEGQAAAILRLTDKTLNNFLHIGEIHLGMPQARIVHCRRNPVDTCVSCYKTPFEAGLGFTCDLRALGRYYRGYHELMQHWEQVLPGKCLHLDYESLVSDPEGQIRALLQWLEVDFHPDCLEFHKNPRQVQLNNLTQVRQPVYKDSIGLWRRYEKHLGPLLEELGELAQK